MAKAYAYESASVVPQQLRAIPATMNQLNDIITALLEAAAALDNRTNAVQGAASQIAAKAAAGNPSPVPPPHPCELVAQLDVIIDRANDALYRLNLIIDRIEL